jgi:long-chain acyl-CoA synthetase
MTPESGAPEAGWAEPPMRGPGDILSVAARRHGDKTALITARRSFGYADLDDVTRDAPPDVPGELMVRGPIVMMGYFANEAETSVAIKADGWLHTGDIACADTTGHFFIVDPQTGRSCCRAGPVVQAASSRTRLMSTGYYVNGKHG